MYKFNNNQSPAMFNDLIKKTNHRYPTNSDNNFILEKYFLSRI